MDSNLLSQFDALQSADAATRRAAVEQLSQCDASLVGWAVAIVKAAGDHDDHVRAWAADVLETLGPPRLADLPQLAHLLSEPLDGEVAYWSATMLGRLGPAAYPATDVLVAVVQRSPFLPVRERAVWALGRIGPRAKAATALLRELSGKGPPRLRRLATAALESLRGMAA